jgi:putative metallohydrolase (TIGR04338 family)
VSAEGVYAAESTIDPGRAFETIDGVQEYLDVLCSFEWWSGRFPGVIRIEAVGIRSRCVEGVGRPELERNAGVIGVTRVGQKELTVLHEVAHAVCRPAAAHGPEWARTYLELTYRVMGADTWSALRDAFVTRGVGISFPAEV